MNIINKLFPKAAELEAAQKRIDFLEANNEEWLRKHRALTEAFDNVEAARRTAQAKADELNTKLRDQNDADLTLVCLRISAALIKGEKPAGSDVQRHHDLLAVRQQMGWSNPYNNPYQTGNGLVDLFGSGIGSSLGIWR